MPTTAHRLLVATAAVALAVPVAVSSATGSAAAAPPRPSSSTVVYDSFEAPGGYDLSDYLAKWNNGFGLGEMADVDERSFGGGALTVPAEPFTVGADFSVFDHLKYIAISNEAFPVPDVGSLTFASTITADVSGTEPGRVVHGTYTQSGAPYAASTLEGQQAGVVMNMVNFQTGQLFDWFVSGSTAFALVERLPASVTGSPAAGTRETMYTQIVKEIPVGPGPHRVAIRFSRNSEKSFVEFFFDDRLVSRVDRVGVPLDVQRQRFTGYAPAMGPGEELADRLDSFALGHGLFSLLDAFPYQHPSAPELSVSIPLSERLFGQGATGTWDDFTVTTVAVPGRPAS